MDSETEKAVLTAEDTKIMRLGSQAIDRGIHFKTLRKHAGLTLTGAAKRLARAGDPLSKSMLSKFETGKTGLRADTLKRLEVIYGVPRDERRENDKLRAADTERHDRLAKHFAWLRSLKRGDASAIEPTAAEPSEQVTELRGKLEAALEAASIASEVIAGLKSQVKTMADQYRAMEQELRSKSIQLRECKAAGQRLVKRVNEARFFGESE